MTVENLARGVIESTEHDLRPLEIAVNLTHWNASTTGTPEAQAAAKEAEQRLRVYLSSKARYEQIADILKSEELHDPLLRRQLELLALEHRPNLLPEAVIDDLVQRGNQIQSEFYTFRAQLNGREVTNNQILGVLRSEPDERRRRAAWEASKQIAPRVADRLRELVQQRNLAARSLGFRDYYAMQLQLHEIDERELFQVLGAIKERTDAPFREAKAQIDARVAARFATHPAKLRPWHYEDPFFQEPPLSQELGLGPHFRGRDLVGIATGFYDGIGLPIRDVLDRSDLFERDGKDQHAYCTHIDRGGDVRILCNLQDNERWMGILLHELGHAAYEKFTPTALPWILRQPAHIAVTEAIAMFMDRLAYDMDWVESAAGITVGDRSITEERAARALRFEMLLTARWVLVMSHFERALYADPRRADLDDYWWDLVEQLQYVPRPDDRRAPDWAAKIHLTVAPVYYHNYLLGELIASQLTASLYRDVLDGRPPAGYVGLAQLGVFFRDRVFSHGASHHWQSLLESATGSRLSAEPFLQEFAHSAEPAKPKGA